MNVEDLIVRFREDADDLVGPAYLWEEPWIVRWLDEAHNEAAIRARILYEAANPAICQIAVVASQAVYNIHKSLYEIVRLDFLPAGETRRQPVKLKTREELDEICYDWRTKTDDARVLYAIQDDKRLTLAYTPQISGTLYLEGYRLPLVPLEDDYDEPEINEVHHRHLVQWALHRAFSKPDSESVDSDRAKAALVEFTRYFGARPDVGLRRESRFDQPQHNRPW